LIVLKKININRRNFIMLFVAAGATFSTFFSFMKGARSANLGGVQKGENPFGGDAEKNKLLSIILRRQLPYVAIDQQTIDVFYRDLIRFSDRFESLLIVENRLRMYPNLSQSNRPDPIVKYYSTNLSREFLLSTSFFYDKKLRYLGIYSPYTRPCQNPFAVLD
jgi:hypothetical protein